MTGRSIVKKFTTEAGLLAFLTTIEIDVYISRHKVLIANTDNKVYRIYLTEELYNKYKEVTNLNLYFKQQVRAERINQIIS
jgi:hypothetical protein